MREQKKKGKNAEVEIKDDRILIDKFANVKSVNNNNIWVKSHCFKLEPAQLLKNLSFDKKKPVYEPFEHCHIFHTYDSNGKELVATNAVGGHYHEINLTEENGEFKAICSAPISNKNSNELLSRDTHTHKVTYLKSEEFPARRISLDAAKYVSSFLSERSINDVSDAGERK